MECPISKDECVKLDTSDMTKIPCEECEIFIQAEIDDQNDFMMKL